MDDPNEIQNAENNNKQEFKILMVGLDEAGKTALLYKLKLGKDVKTIPTIGFNDETVEFEDTSFKVWDIGGLNTVRCLWNFYTENKSAVIFVVDSSQPDRFEEAKGYLHTVMAKEDLLQAVLSVLANKQDKLEDADNVVDLEESLDLKNIKQSWRICKICAIGDASPDIVLQDLCEMLKKINK